MPIIIGEKVRIRGLVREDVNKMQLWGKHEDPLFLNYNFPKLTTQEADDWFKIKTLRLKKKCFAIENLENRLVGYISIRDIKWIKKESELGIVLDPNYINQGYGTEAINLFLGYYFNRLRMSSIKLRTAKYNERAIRCYLNCGFQKVGESMDEFEDQFCEIFYNPVYRYLYGYFKEVNGKKMTDYYYMELSREGFYKNSNKLSTISMADCE